MAGHEVWRDRTSLAIGDNWKKEVEFGIKSSDEIVVLLTPKSAASEAVTFEIGQAIGHCKRINVFTTFDPRTAPAVNRLISETNYVTIADGDVSPALLALHLLGNEANSHPVGIREYEWLASRRIFPRFDGLLSQNYVNMALVDRYFGYRGVFERYPDRANGVVWLNLALCGVLAGDRQLAMACIETAAKLMPHPVVQYFHVCLLLQRTRPRHLAPALLDRCIAIAQSALEAQRSPLIAILLSALLADGQRAHGPTLARLCADALDAAADVERDRSEILRLLWFLPITEETVMPVPTTMVLQKLKRVLGE